MEENRKDDLEYNDGLGDLLREKERLEFNWIKTGLVLLGLIGIIFLFLVFVFNIGKRLLTSEPTAVSIEQSKSITDIERENQALLEEINKSSSSSTIEIKVPKTKRIAKTSAKSTKSIHKIIVGTYSSRKNANLRVSNLKKQNVSSFVTTIKGKNGPLYRVQAGAFSSRKVADKALKTLKSKKIDGYIVRTKS